MNDKLGPWYNGTRCGMQIPQLEFNSHRVPKDHVMLTLGKSTLP